MVITQWSPRPLCTHDQQNDQHENKGSETHKHNTDRKGEAAGLVHWEDKANGPRSGKETVFSKTFKKNDNPTLRRGPGMVYLGCSLLIFVCSSIGLDMPFSLGFRLGVVIRWADSFSFTFLLQT